MKAHIALSRIGVQIRGWRITFYLSGVIRSLRSYRLGQLNCGCVAWSWHLKA